MSPIPPPMNPELAAIGAAQSVALTHASADPSFDDLQAIVERHNDNASALSKHGKGVAPDPDGPDGPDDPDDRDDPDDPARMIVQAIVPPSRRLADAFVVARDELLVWGRDLEPVRRVLARARFRVVAVREATPRVRRLVLRTPSGNGDRQPLLQAAGVVRDGGFRVSLNHVLIQNVTAKAMHAPAVPSPIVLPPRLGADIPDVGRGHGVTVAVVDTGLEAEPYERTDGWFTGVSGTPDPDTTGTHDRRKLPVGAGHGTAVAGVIRQVAPAAEVRVYRALSRELGSEVHVALAMMQAAAEGADIINLSLGTAALAEHAPLAMEDALAHIPRRVLVVAAAGNENSTVPRFPAAFKRVVAVGATEADGSPSPWSARGHWVDVSVRGCGVATPFAQGEIDTTIPDTDPPQVRTAQFKGPNPTAVLSGTSLAAPQVAGALAALLSDGIPPAHAVAALTANGRRVADFGVVIHLLEQ